MSIFVQVILRAFGFKQTRCSFPIILLSKPFSYIMVYNFKSDYDCYFIIIKITSVKKKSLFLDSLNNARFVCKFSSFIYIFVQIVDDIVSLNYFVIQTKHYLLRTSELAFWLLDIPIPPNVNIGMQQTDESMDITRKAVTLKILT